MIIKKSSEEVITWLEEITGGLDILDESEGYIRFTKYQGREYMWTRTSDGVDCKDITH